MNDLIPVLPISIKPDTPELTHLMTFADSIVLAGIPNSGTREAYRFALSRFFSWYRVYNAREGGKFDRTAIMTHLALPEVQNLASSTRNCALAALKRLSRELHYRQLISFETWQGINDLKSEKQQSNKAPNWLTEKQLDELMRLPDDTLHGLRDRVILAVVTGCGLRRTELCDLKIGSMEQRSGRWVFVVKGKGGKTRFAPIPNGVKVVIDMWLDARGFTCCAGGQVTPDMYLVCPVMQGDVVKHRRLSDDVIYDVVREYGVRLGVPSLAPHDCRRTFARLTKDAGADLDQIQFNMGHESVSTTQRYIGDNVNLVHAPGDLLRTDWTGKQQ